MSDNDEHDDAAPTIDVTDRAAALVTRMTDDVGLWETRVDAALFLASLALHQGRDPVAADELDSGNVTVGALSEATQGLDQAGELALFQLLRAPRDELEDVLQRDLKGLVEAGADALGPKLRGSDPAGAVDALIALMDP